MVDWNLIQTAAILTVIVCGIVGFAADYIWTKLMDNPQVKAFSRAASKFGKGDDDSGGDLITWGGKQFVKGILGDMFSPEAKKIQLELAKIKATGEAEAKLIAAEAAAEIARKAAAAQAAAKK